MVWGGKSPFDDEMTFSNVTGRIPDSLLLTAVYSNKISPGHNTTGNRHDNLQVPSSDLWIERPLGCCCWPA